MRDLHLRHTLKTLARDAAAVFAEIVEGGQEIPYEIAEPGDSFAFCQYRPLTAKFVRDNAAELRELESFREATETMRRSDIAATYLEEAGIAPPADGVERATLAVTYFLARLWDGCSDFEVDEDRFSAALEEVEECSEPDSGEIEAIVPLVGLKAPAGRIDLNGAAIVRADTVDAPAEAARSERAPGAEWEPTFLISARIALDADGGLAGAGDRVAETFERVVTTLRLLRPGGVGLGPYGWVRVAGDRWRRIATGAARPRNGGYALSEEQIPELVELARTVSVHPKRLDRMRRALLRFESGLDRRGAIDALNDHLLGLRFLLEGEGPAGVGLPMRAAALGAAPERRTEAKQIVERAIGLERELWSGERIAADGFSPSEVASRVEALLRTILRRGISGELGADLRAAADETLLADGLAVGEGAQLRAPSRGEPAESSLEPEHAPEPEWALEAEAEEAFEAETTEHDSAAAFDRFEADPEPEIVASRPGREPEPATAAAGDECRGTDPDRDWTEDEAEPKEEPMEPSTELEDERDLPVWLEEVDEGPRVTMAFPKGDPARRENHIEELSKPPMERDEVTARVQYLFPRTETDWTVGRGPKREARAG